jgi:hypothetical protein
MRNSLLFLSLASVLVVQACSDELGLVSFNEEGALVGVTVEPGPRIQFGDVFVGSGGSEVEVVIRSTGETAFLLEELSIRGEDAAHFSLPGLSLPMPILPGEELPVRIQFLPPEARPFLAEFWVDTDFGQDAPIRRQLLATGVK